MEIIEDLREDFFRAHYNTSFSPEARADQCVKDFSEELEADIAELGDKAGEYTKKYVERLRSWTSKKSRCLSVMITGPANFPTKRNRKAFNSEQNAWTEFREWRDRYIHRANRIPVRSPEEEIDDALLKLEKERNAHALMVEANKICRRKISDDEKRKAFTEELEISEQLISELLIPDCTGNYGFASYALTNSNARIKNLEEKVLIMRKRIETRDAFKPIPFSGGIIDIADDRVIIKHDAKPEQHTINSLKARGFHWSPKNQYWCRKHTANALTAAKSICSVQ